MGEVGRGQWGWAIGSGSSRKRLGLSGLVPTPTAHCPHLSRLLKNSAGGFVRVIFWPSDPSPKARMSSRMRRKGTAQTYFNNLIVQAATVPTRPRSPSPSCPQQGLFTTLAPSLPVTPHSPLRHRAQPPQPPAPPASPGAGSPSTGFARSRHHPGPRISMFSTFTFEEPPLRYFPNRAGPSQVI